MFQLRHYAAGAALAIATLVTGCANRPMEVPSSAQLMTEGNGDRLTFRAAEAGRVYVSNESDGKILYQGEVRRGDAVEVTPKDDRIQIDGRTVTETSMGDGEQYKIYFEPMERGRTARYRVVEERVRTERVR